MAATMMHVPPCYVTRRDMFTSATHAQNADAADARFSTFHVAAQITVQIPHDALRARRRDVTAVLRSIRHDNSRSSKRRRRLMRCDAVRRGKKKNTEASRRYRAKWHDSRRRRPRSQPAGVFDLRAATLARAIRRYIMRGDAQPQRKYQPEPPSRPAPRRHAGTTPAPDAMLPTLTELRPASRARPRAFALHADASNSCASHAAAIDNVMRLRRSCRFYALKGARAVAPCAKCRSARISSRHFAAFSFDIADYCFPDATFWYFLRRQRCAVAVVRQDDFFMPSPAFRR